MRILWFIIYQWMTISKKIEYWKCRWYTNRINIYPVNLVTTVLLQILWTELWISSFLLVSSTSTLIIINRKWNKKRTILIHVVDDKIKEVEMRRTNWCNGAFHSAFYFRLQSCISISMFQCSMNTNSMSNVECILYTL